MVALTETSAHAATQRDADNAEIHPSKIRVMVFVQYCPPGIVDGRGRRQSESFSGEPF